MAFLDYDFLDPRRKGKKLHLDVAGRAVLEEIDIFGGVLPDDGAYLLRRHPHQLAPGSLLPGLVEPFGEGLADIGGRLAAEIRRQRPIEADNVAGQIKPAAGYLPGVDHVARLDQRGAR